MDAKVKGQGHKMTFDENAQNWAWIVMIYVVYWVLSMTLKHYQFNVLIFYTQDLRENDVLRSGTNLVYLIRPRRKVLWQLC